LLFAGTFHEAVERGPVDLVEILLDEAVERGPVDLVEILLVEPVERGPVDLVEILLVEPVERGPVDLVEILLDEAVERGPVYLVEVLPGPPAVAVSVVVLLVESVDSRAVVDLVVVPLLFAERHAAEGVEPFGWPETDSVQRVYPAVLSSDIFDAISQNLQVSEQVFLFDNTIQIL